MSKVVNCPCGATVKGATDDELVANVQAHAREIHDGMAVSREQALEMAKPEA